MNDRPLPSFPKPSHLTTTIYHLHGPTVYTCMHVAIHPQPAASPDYFPRSPSRLITVFPPSLAPWRRRQGQVQVQDNELRLCSKDIIIISRKCSLAPIYSHVFTTTAFEMLIINTSLVDVDSARFKDSLEESVSNLPTRQGISSTHFIINRYCKSKLSGIK